MLQNVQLNVVIFFMKSCFIDRSAREAEECERKARESGEILPTEKRFDSNCITPGY
jgi:5'-3' exonuclease